VVEHPPLGQIAHPLQAFRPNGLIECFFIIIWPAEIVWQIKTIL